MAFPQWNGVAQSIVWCHNSTLKLLVAPMYIILWSKFLFWAHWVTVDIDGSFLWLYLCGNTSKRPPPPLQYLWQTCSADRHFSWDYRGFFKLQTTITLYMTVCTYHLFYEPFTCSDTNPQDNDNQNGDQNRGKESSNTQSITSVTPTRVTCIWIGK